MLDSLLYKFNKYIKSEKLSVKKNALLLVSLILEYEQVNLNKLKKGVGNYLENLSTNDSSHYKRLTRFFEENKAQIAVAYSIRWQIEVCFKHMKSNGFNLENTAITNHNKLNLLMNLVVLVYCIAVNEGFKHMSKIKKKVYKDGKQYYQASIFRKVLDKVAGKHNSFVLFLQYLIEVYSIAEKTTFHKFSIHVQ